MPSSSSPKGDCHAAVVEFRIETQQVDDDAETVNTNESVTSQKEPASRLQLMTTAALLCGIVLTGGWLWRSICLQETRHDSWQHIESANSASVERETNMLTHIGPNGMQSLVPVVQVGQADFASDVTESIRSALWKDEVAVANQRIETEVQATTAIDAKTSAEVQHDFSSDPDMVLAIKRGDTKFFQLQMRDCCHEDGDVVSLAVNGTPYATIPLTHAGAVVTLPLSSGVSLVTLTGVKDGGGGITIQFSSSQGDYFARAMKEGEEYHIGVAAP